MVMDNVKVCPEKFPLSQVLLHSQYSKSIIIFTQKSIMMNLYISIFSFLLFWMIPLSANLNPENTKLHNMNIFNKLTDATAFGFLLISICIYKHKWGRFHDMLNKIKQHHRTWLWIRFLNEFQGNFKKKDNIQISMAINYFKYFVYTL